MWSLLDIKKMNQANPIKPNFCPQCGEKLIDIKDVYRKCPNCGWGEKQKKEDENNNPFISIHHCPFCGGAMKKRKKIVREAWGNKRTKEYFQCLKCGYKSN